MTLIRNEKLKIKSLRIWLVFHINTDDAKTVNLCCSNLRILGKVGEREGTKTITLGTLQAGRRYQNHHFQDYCFGRATGALGG